jgi:thioredoxin
MVRNISTKDAFDSLLKQNEYVVVDFFAEWCGPCKQIAPFVEDLAKRNEGRVVFAKVDVDEVKQVAESERITSMPTFRFFFQGRRVAEVKGADRNGLESALARLLSMKVAATVSASDAAKAVEHKDAGNKAFKDGDKERALAEFTRAMELDPSNAVYASNRSMVFASLERFEEALEDGERAVALKPDWGKAHSRVGLALYKLEKYREAVAAYEAGLALEPNDAQLRSGLEQSREALSSSNPMGQMFGPQMWARLAANPKTAAAALDPRIRAKLQQLSRTPK